MTEMIEVVIDSIRVGLMSPQRLVVLRQADSNRYLPIWVGPYEAEAISIALQELTMARPLTHDLLLNVLKTFGGTLRRVEIVDLRDDIFIGTLIIESNGQTLMIDSRSSDAIALAVRAHVPIFVARSVMEAAIQPEQDVRAETPPAVSPETPAAQPGAAADAPSLSVFEDFFSKLEKKKDDDETQA